MVRRLLQGALAAAVLLASSATARSPVTPVRQLMEKSRARLAPRQESEDPYPVHTFAIPIDHFRDSPRYEPHTDEKFDVQYWFDASHYEDGGPVIILHGGETDGADRLPFLQKGVLAQLTAATHGIGVVLEHRYYGQSIPTPDFSTENLRFLSTEQALADSAYFAQNIVFPGLEDKKLQSCDTPYIIYGGSYAGAQVAFMRVEYPDVFWGAISSSGVTKAIYDFWEYYEPVRKYGPGECVLMQQTFTHMLDNILIGKKGDKKLTQRLKDLFGLGELTYLDDFANTLAQGISYWQSVNWDPAVSSPTFDYYCGNLTSDELLYDNEGLKEEATKLIKAGGYKKQAKALTNRLLNYVGFVDQMSVKPCVESNSTMDQCMTGHNETFYKADDLSQTWRLWPYQVCTEWGYLQVGSTVPETQLPMISRLIDLEYTSIMCREAFGIYEPSKVENVNKYGAFDIEYERLAFVDGQVDPWRPATPHAEGQRDRKNTLDKPFILIEGAGHHWDENGLFPNETTPELPPKQVVDAQRQEIKFVKKWLKGAARNQNLSASAFPGHFDHLLAESEVGQLHQFIISTYISTPPAAALDPTPSPRSIELVDFDSPSSAPSTTPAVSAVSPSIHTTTNNPDPRPRHRADGWRNTARPRTSPREGGRNYQEEDLLAVGPGRVAEDEDAELKRRHRRRRRRNPRLSSSSSRLSVLSSLSSGSSLPGSNKWEARESEEEEFAEDYNNTTHRNSTKRRKGGITGLFTVTRRRQATDDDIMKFSHSIQFNAVPDWSNNYIAYSNLKKLIYSLEKQVHRLDETGENVESAPLLDSSIDTDTIFRRALDNELEKVCSFYHSMEAELYEEVDNVVRDEESYIEETKGLNMDPVSDTLVRTRTLSFNRPRQGSLFQSLGFGNRDARASTISESVTGEDRNADMESDDELDPDDVPPHDHDGHGRRRPSWKDDHGKHSTDPLDRAISDMSESRIFGAPHDQESAIDPNYSALYNAGLSLKKRVISIYVSLCDLKSFIQLNRTGFTKALKKYDKILDRSLRRPYMNTTVSTAYPFISPTIDQLNDRIARIEEIYATLVTKGDISLSRRELRLHLREHVVWERNTVWREMIGIERKAQAANMGIRRTLLGGDQDPLTAQRQGDEQEVTTKEFVTPVGRCPVPTWLLSSSFFTLVAIVIIFCVMLVLPIMSKPEQQNCLAMLVFVSLLWATEVIPLFVTSLLVPFLVVVLRIMRSDEAPYNRLGTKEATTVTFAAMWTPVIMLLLGGFTIAAALSKYDIARRMATFVLSKAGTKPRVVLVTNMFVSMVLSMFISNVAAPVLCFSIIQPMLRNLPVDSHFSKALILGIALASNIGGAASPIASPQNIIALQNMNPSISWGTWFFIALPVCIISILLIWILLLITFHPGRGTTIVPIRPVKDKYSGVQWFITIVTLFTIILWCVSHELEATFGDMGVIAIIPLVLFFGTGILTKEDFNNFLWTIIILASGGLCLGHAVTSSGLLHTIAGAITEQVADFSLYGVLVTFSALILVVATFISHTVAALIMLPLVEQVGSSMEHPHPNLLVMGSALMCSVAMGLPTSGFPNMTAIMMEVPETGQRYLRVRHFLTRGIPASIMSFGIVVTVGYGLMLVAGL
ncbi:low-affinity phosphate transporter [Emmonsiellopsis sp. PD_33]|nr:low-affinity phosphate transporter [Emmonsiellopsis sp. PD_33]